MTAPQLTVYQSGITVLSADGLNTFQQTCDTMSQLRSFAGTYGVTVFVRGQQTPNDGLQGVFYWNASLSGQADDNNTVIIPSGVSLGGWQRLSSSGTGTGLVSTSNSTVTIAGSGTVNIVTGTNLQFLPGQYVTIANGANYIYGLITSYTSATGALTFTAQASGGSGSYSTWNVTGAIPPAAAGILFTAFSSTSVAIGTGSKTFTIASGKAFGSGFVFAQSSSNPAKYMTGYVTSYSGSTLTITVPTGGTGGSGAALDWNITASGAIGASGSYLIGAAAGTADAITTTIVGATTISGQVIAVASTFANGNTTSTPTLTLNSDGAGTITALGGKAGWSDMIGPVGFVGLYEYSAAGNWEMQNPITAFYPLNVTTSYSAGQKDTFSAIRSTNAATVTLASSSTLISAWNASYYAQGGAVTFALQNSNDKINAGTSGASLTVATGAAGFITTDASGNFWIGGTVGALTNIANTFTAAQSFPASGILIKGSSTGYTTVASANTGASSYTITMPAATDTVAVLGQTQTFSKAIIGSPVALTVSANAVAVDLSLANNFTLTLQATTGQTLSNPTNIVAGQSGVIAITQNATPSTLAYGSYWIEATVGAASAVSTTAGAQNILSYYVFDATHIYYTLNKHGVV